LSEDAPKTSTPAMEAGIADHVWRLEELVGLLEQTMTEAAA